MCVAAEKQALRRKYLALRACLRGRSEKNLEIQSRFLGSRFYSQGGAVFLYVSKEDEVDTRGVLSACWANGRRVAAPRCMDAEGAMAFYWIAGWDDLVPGRFGVLEPDAHCAAAEPEPRDVCIVPGLSFDAAGFRLGYGKGYYDRFLSGFPGDKVGFCYDPCMAWRLPRDEYDRAVHAVVTEHFIREIRKAAEP